jgi:hypothetical protein
LTLSSLCTSSADMLRTFALEVSAVNPASPRASRDRIFRSAQLTAASIQLFKK